jgi:hypothetical protein
MHAGQIFPIIIDGNTFGFSWKKTAYDGTVHNGASFNCRIGGILSNNTANNIAYKFPHKNFFFLRGIGYNYEVQYRPRYAYFYLLKMEPKDDGLNIDIRLSEDFDTLVILTPDSDSSDGALNANIMDRHNNNKKYGMDLSTNKYVSFVYSYPVNTWYEIHRR